MPTNANDGVLDRDQASKNLAEFEQRYGPLRREVINYGTHVLLRCAASAGTEKDEHLGSSALFIHILEMADAVDILLSQSSVNPTVVMFRSIVEALFQLDYLLDDDYKTKRRQWLVTAVHRSIRNAEVADPTSESGVRLASAIKSDKHLKGKRLPIAAVDRTNEAVEGYERILLREELKSAEDAYEAVAAKLPYIPPWYWLHQGRLNLRKLACEVGREGTYALVYDYWSQIAHATDWRRHAAGLDDEGRLQMYGLRFPENLKTYSVVLISLLLDSIKLMLGFFRPDELKPGGGFNEWLGREVAERFEELKKLEITIAVAET